MNKSQRNRIDELLVKYLSGQASEQEQLEVRQWVGLSENKDYFNQFRLIWQNSAAAVPDSNEDQAWERLKLRIRTPSPRTIPLGRRRDFSILNSKRLIRIAALLLVFVGAGWLAYFVTRQPATLPVVHQQDPHLLNSSVRTATVGNVELPYPDMRQEQVSSRVLALVNGYEHSARRADKPVMIHNKVILEKGKKVELDKDGKTREFICNATPCPIEICIVQTVRCLNNQPKEVSTCSIIEPDESGQLNFKTFGKVEKHCMSDIEEIRIKRISTGEMIILNTDSRPSTAQDFFSYLTGQKNGGIVAGVFHTDCNNHPADHGLTIANNYGNLSFQ